MSRILWRSSLRHLLRHPWQIGLSILGIALGVAVVISIDLANQSAQRAFELSTETIAGRATHQITGGSAGVPEELYVQLRVEAGVRPIAPIVEGDVAAPAYPGRAFHILGVDPFAEGPFRSYLTGLEADDGGLVLLLTHPNTALLSSETAAQLGLRAGDSIEIRVGTARRSLLLAGLLHPADEISRRALESLIITDIATAQELFDTPGRLSRIDLIIPEGSAGDALLEQVRALLPAGVELERAAARSQAIEQMTRAFSLNLMALSLLALIVGIFLIYNTMTFSVIQRRTLIGTLRALGVTRREIFTLVLSEALIIGLIGTGAGLLLGIMLGRGMVRLVTQTINDLYFVLSLQELTIAPLVLLKGLLLGLGATLVAALVPAFEATSTPPRAVLTRSTIESRLRWLVPRAALGGVLLALAATVMLLVPSKSLWLGFGALWALLFGFALLTPAATVLLMRLLRPVMGRLFGVLGRMSARGVVVALSRTAIAIAALMIAVSVTVGVGIMIGSFRQTVVRWLDSSLQADVYVSPPSLVSSRSDAPLDPALVQRLSTAPGVKSASTYRGIIVNSPYGPTQLIALELDNPRRDAECDAAACHTSAFTFKEGEPQEIWPAFFEAGAAIISEPYAYRHNLHAGSRIRLGTDRGEREFSVAGVFYDYGSDQGVVMISRQTYEQLWDDRAISSLVIYAEEGVDVDALVESLRVLAGPEHDVLIRSNKALREASLEVFDRTFAITAVLRLLATLVAFVGVLSALMALQLERARELGVLRANGLTPRQVWGLVTSQTGLMGLVAGLLSIPVGIVMALVLIYIINKRSFGWTLQMELSPGILLQALLLALLAAILAGIYPAIKMARTSPALALREE